MKQGFGEKHHLTCGSETIDFLLYRSERKTLEIAVHPDATVTVKAPVAAELTAIHARLRRRVRWILRQLNFFQQFHPRSPDRCYVNGESHRYLGRKYRLKFRVAQQPSVSLIGGRLCVDSPRILTTEETREMILAWYKEKARRHFSESLDRCWLKFAAFGFSRPRISIRRMKKRWGSLSSSGTITLNLVLIGAPKSCIDYVVTHELCHLLHKNHNQEFYRRLDSLLPGWKKIKQRLEFSLI